MERAVRRRDAERRARGLPVNARRVGSSSNSSNNTAADSRGTGNSGVHNVGADDSRGGAGKLRGQQQQ